MSAQDQANIATLQQEMVAMQQHVMNLNQHFLAAVNALVERLEVLEAGNNAVGEGSDVKAAPNGRVRKGR